MSTATFNKGEAYRRGRRIARELAQTEGAACLRAVVEKRNQMESDGQLSGPALHEHWGARSILREEHSK